MFYLLNYKSLILFKVSHNQIQPIKQLVIPVRFELTTYGLEDRYSIQLSYGTIKNITTFTSNDINNNLSINQLILTLKPCLGRGT